MSNTKLPALKDALDLLNQTQEVLGRFVANHRNPSEKDTISELLGLHDCAAGYAARKAVSETLALFASLPAPQAVQADNALTEVLKERDDADDFIDALLDEVLGGDRPEWSSAYGRADALAQVQEVMAALQKPLIDRAWAQFEKGVNAAAPSPDGKAEQAKAPSEQESGEERTLNELLNDFAMACTFAYDHEVRMAAAQRIHALFKTERLYRKGLEHGIQTALDQSRDLTVADPEEGHECSACSGHGRRLETRLNGLSYWATCPVCNGLCRIAQQDFSSPEGTTMDTTESTTNLNDNEQYRLQMAGISTAALGYWKEGDPIHPDLDTPALRDVAKLYAKYGQLYRATNGGTNVRLDHDSNPAEPGQQRQLAGSVAMGQPVVNGQDAGAGDSQS